LTRGVEVILRRPFVGGRAFCWGQGVVTVLGW
jgi:hypothetical protein